MIENDFLNLELFITGPTFVCEEAKKAALLPDFGHRDSENDKRFAPILSNLKTLAGLPETDEEYDAFLINGSGSTALEASIRSLVADDETILTVSVGAFGDLYHNICIANGKKAVQLKFDPGTPMDLATLEQAVITHSPAVVAMTHNETSTGVINPIAQACALVRKHGALPLVDGVSIFGGTSMDLPEMKPAFYSTATQKCLALPAGFGIGFAHKEALAKAEKVTNKGYSSDILRQAAKGRNNQALTTPNTTLLNMLWAQLERIINVEGMENRFARHKQMQELAAQWVAATNGLDSFVEDGFRSPALTTVLAPAGTTIAQLKKLKEQMRARGYLFDPGYGKLNANLEEQGKRPVFRIGHMGDITPEMLERYLSILGEEIANI